MSQENGGPAILHIGAFKNLWAVSEDLLMVFPEAGNHLFSVMSRQVCKSSKRFSSSSIYLAAARGRGISSNLPVTFASDSALK
jgi:hypothetical protein